jgi:hypothetical protein
VVSVEHEDLVRAFILEFPRERVDRARVEVVLDPMAADARYHLFAWEDPFVGRDAIREEVLRQAAGRHPGDARTATNSSS